MDFLQQENINKIYDAIQKLSPCHITVVFGGGVSDEQESRQNAPSEIDGVYSDKCSHFLTPGNLKHRRAHVVKLTGPGNE